MDGDEPKKAGRPSVWTPELVARFVDVIRDAIARGMPFEASIRRACRKAGVTRQAYDAARRRAESGEEPYASAVAVIEDARDELHLTLCARVLALAESGDKTDGVRLAATRFATERLFPEHAPSKRVELSGPEGGPIETVARVVVMPPFEDDPAGTSAADLSDRADAAAARLSGK